MVRYPEYHYLCCIRHYPACRRTDWKKDRKSVAGTLEQPGCSDTNEHFNEIRTGDAGRAKTFFRVILPELTPALLTGFGLALARGIGEYGSVIYISGNSAKNHTQVISYVIMQKLNYIDYESATAIALVMLVFSFLILLFVNIIQVRQTKKTL